MRTPLQVSDEKLVALVLCLREEDRRCIQNDIKALEPKIICSLGIRRDRVKHELRVMKTDALALQAERRILLIRKQRVMLSDDLAVLYSVETKALNRAVKRNRERFPDDFMFQLTKREWDDLKCQLGTSSSLNLKSQIVTSSWGGSRVPPYAFTEQGVAMLSSVLRSPRAGEHRHHARLRALA